MLSPLPRYRNTARSPIPVLRYLTLFGLLSGCASGASQQPTYVAATSETANDSPCSFLGRLACRAMAAVSNDGSGIRQATCTASRTGATYVETCGVAGSTVAAPVLPPPKPQTAPTNVGVTARSSVRLSWQDNANNETGFVIERCDQIIGDLGKPKPAVSCRGNWQTVGSVAANITTYVDNTVTANQTYMYRVKAVNPSGSSAYTPEAVITAPLK